MVPEMGWRRKFWVMAWVNLSMYEYCKLVYMGSVRRARGSARKKCRVLYAAVCQPQRQGNAPCAYGK